MVVLCCIVVVTGFLPFPVSRSSLSSPPSQVSHLSSNLLHRRKLQGWCEDAFGVVWRAGLPSLLCTQCFGSRSGTSCVSGMFLRLYKNISSRCLGVYAQETWMSKAGKKDPVKASVSVFVVWSVWRHPQSRKSSNAARIRLVCHHAD